MSDRAADILRNQDAMKRDNWEQHWQEIAELVLPRYAEFTGSRASGEKRTDKIFDGSPQSALRMFSSAMDSMLTPRTQRWHRLKAKPAQLNDQREVKEYLEQVEDALFMLRQSPRANFHAQLSECYMMLGAFGTQGLYIEEDTSVPGGGARYQAVPLAELYFLDDAFGQLLRVHRKFKLTAIAALRTYGPERLPPKILGAAERAPADQFEFIHCVRRNDKSSPYRADALGMKYASETLCIEGKSIVRESGYRTMPYCVSRYYKGPGEQYGRGPGMEVLPDIKMLNEMEKTIIRAAHKEVDPPMLLADDNVLAGPFSMTPGALNWGAVSANGTQLAVPLKTGANIMLGAELMDAKRKIINDAFLVTLFQILVATPRMTATEVLERAQEKGILLGPIVGRQQSEFLGPMIERELDIAEAFGRLPPPPAVLADYGGEYEVEYESPITRALKAEGVAGILRTIESMTPLAAIDPKVTRRINTDEAVKYIFDASGAPTKVLRTDEQLQAMDEAEAQAQQMQQMLEAAPIAAQAAKTAAEAEMLAGAAPRRLPMGV